MLPTVYHQINNSSYLLHCYSLNVIFCLTNCLRQSRKGKKNPHKKPTQLSSLILPSLGKGSQKDTHNTLTGSHKHRLVQPGQSLYFPCYQCTWSPLLMPSLSASPHLLRLYYSQENRFISLRNLNF